MSTFQRAVRMLQRNKKEAFAYVITLSVTTCLLFLFVNIQKDANFLNQNIELDASMKLTSNMIGGFLTLLIIAICFVNTFIVNNFYNHALAQELCVYLSSGMNVFALTRYLLMQNLLLLGGAVVIGGMLGLGLHIALNQLIYQFMGFQGATITLTWEGLLMWFVILAIEIIFLVLMNVGYAYKAELKDLLVEARTTQAEDKRKLRIPPMFYVGILLLGWIGMFFTDSVGMIMVCACIGMLGIHGMLHNGVRDMVEKRKKKHAVVDFQKVLIQGNLIHLLGSNYLSIILIMSSVVFMSSLQGIVQKFPYLLITSCAAYILVLVVMSISMMFKITMLANKRQDEFVMLRLMGAKEKEMKACARKEVFLLFNCVLLLPMLYAGTICFLCVQNEFMEVSFLYFILGSYLLSILICMLISLRLYCHIALNKKEEEINE